MISLEELITYWKRRIHHHPPHALVPKLDAVEATIKYLEELKKLKETEKGG